MMDLKNGVLKLEANLDPNKAIPLIRLALFNFEEGEIMDEAGALDARPAEGGVEVYVTNMKELADYYGIDNDAKVQKMFTRLLKRLGNEIARDVKGVISGFQQEDGSPLEKAVKDFEDMMRDGDYDFPGWSASTYKYGDEKQIVAALKGLAKSVSPAVVKPRTAAPVQSESIAYADLPWAEKQQNTVNEEKMQKLFPSQRLDEAMERLFEDAPEKREPAKFEEDYLKG